MLGAGEHLGGAAAHAELVVQSALAAGAPPGPHLGLAIETHHRVAQIAGLVFAVVTLARTEPLGAGGAAERDRERDDQQHRSGCCEHARVFMHYIGLLFISLLQLTDIRGLRCNP